MATIGTHSQVNHAIHNAWLLYEESKFEDIHKLMNTINSNEYDCIEYNQGPTQREKEFIKYMVNKYDCTVGAIWCYTYLYFNFPNWPISGVDDITHEYRYPSASQH